MAPRNRSNDQADYQETQVSDAGTNQPTPQQAPADAAAGVTLEHTEGGATTRDEMDAGVAMTQGEDVPDAPAGPEDAFSAAPTRGDYSDRLVAGPSMTAELIPEDERVPDGPTQRLVPQTAGVRVDAAAAGAQPSGS